MSFIAPKGFFGWRVMWAALVVAVFGWGVGFYGPPVFLHTLATTRGWSIGLISTAVTAHYLFGAFIVASMPAVYRKFGLAATTKASAVSLALGMLGWALAEAPWQLFLATIASGAGWAGMGAVAINTMIARWFERQRPKALSIAYNGASAGGVLLTPIWVALIAEGGLAMASTVVGLVMVLVIWILCDRYFSKTPASLGTQIDGDPGAATAPPRARSGIPERPGPALWRSRAFVTYAGGFTVGLFVQVAIIAHLISLLAPALGTQGAGLAAGFATACAIAGRTLVGWFLSPTADRRWAAAATYVVQAAGSLVFIVAAGDSVPLLLLGVLLFGVGIGNVTSLPPLIAQAEFAQSDVARAIALATAIAQASYAFAPAIFGLIRELPEGVLATSNVTLFFVVAATLQIVAATIYWAGRSGDQALPQGEARGRARQGTQDACRPNARSLVTDAQKRVGNRGDRTRARSR